MDQGRALVVDRQVQLWVWQQLALLRLPCQHTARQPGASWAAILGFVAFLNFFLTVFKR